MTTTVTTPDSAHGPRWAQWLGCGFILAMVLGGAGLFVLAGYHGLAESELQRAVKAHDAVAVRRLLAAGAATGPTLMESAPPVVLALQGVQAGDAASLEVLEAFLEAPPGEEGFGIVRRVPGGRAIANESFTPPCYTSSRRTCPTYGAIEIAAQTGSPEAVQALVDAGLDVRSEAAVNALVWAAEYFQDDVAEVLLAAGVDPDEPATREGALGRVSAVEAATRVGNRELAARLRGGQAAAGPAP